jgi:hypothetical protein
MCDYLILSFEVHFLMSVCCNPYYALTFNEAGCNVDQRFSNFFQVGTTFISQNVIRTALLLSPLKANCLRFSTMVCDTQFTLIFFFVFFFFYYVQSKRTTRAEPEDHSLRNADVDYYKTSRAIVGWSVNSVLDSMSMDAVITVPNVPEVAATKIFSSYRWCPDWDWNRVVP